MVFQIGLGVLAALTDSLALVGEPRAGFLDDTRLNAEVDQLTALRHAFAVHDVEIDHLEWWRHLVLDYLDTRLVADDLVTLLYRADAPNVEADRSVEFQRVATSRG